MSDSLGALVPHVPALHEHHLANVPALDQFDNLPEVRRRPLLAAGLDHAPVVARGLDHAAALLDGVRQRLFAVDVFAGLAGQDGGDGVPVVGSRDEDRVDILAIQDAAEIGVALGRPADLLDRLREHRLEHIGHRGDLDARRAQAHLHFIKAPRSRTDLADDNPVVGPQDPARRQGRSALEKLSAFHSCYSILFME
jgi:hypothetical protein